MADQDHGHEHHILPNSMAIKVWVALLIFTVITVAVAQVDLGAFNFTVAMLIATVKATMVGAIFMGLKYDSNENRMIFLSSFIFFAIFVVLTNVDVFFRRQIPMNEDFAANAPQELKFKKPWVKTDEILAHGKTLYDIQCASCHGNQGKGDGVAAAGFNPKPRNFTSGTAWAKGRKPSEVYDVLTNGLNLMPSFGSLPIDDRWALAHYVLSFGPAPEKDNAQTLAKVGVDLSKPDGGLGGGKKKEIPIDLAIELMATDS